MSVVNSERRRSGTLENKISLYFLRFPQKFELLLIGIEETVKLPK